MKHFLKGLSIGSVVGAAFSVILVSCTTPQQTVTYNTISSVEQTATAAVNAYFALVVAGKLPTNSVPTVSRAYNDLQAAVILAAAVDQSGTNALAPASLTVEASALINLINTAKGQ